MNQYDRFKGKRVLVSGAASGIGRATARHLAAEGASLVLVDLSEAGLQETAADIGASHAEPEVHVCDISDSAAVRDLFHRIADNGSSLDVLCNIAGIVHADRMEDMAPADWDRVLRVNLSGVFYMSQQALPLLLAEESGCIVNLASSAGLVGQAYTCAYAAAKAGVVSLTRSMALEFSDRGLRVNALCPGAVNTAMSKDFPMPRDPDMALFSRVLPLLSMAEPEEVAAAIAFLASAEARYVTGAALPMDGGQTAG